MRWIIALILIVVLIGPALRSAPVEGISAKPIEITTDGWTATKRFRGGERASVQIAALESTTAMVEITIHDANGKKIAEDKGRPDAPDFAAVFWYPPRDGDYKITISTSRQDAFFVAIR